MKTIKHLLTLAPFLFMNISGCQKDGISATAATTELSKCDTSDYTVRQTIKDATGIIRFISTGQGTDKKTIVCLEPTSLFADTKYLPPCNLPEEFKKDGLAVKFSGEVLTRPEFKFAEIFGYPIQLTTIKDLSGIQ